MCYADSLVLWAGFMATLIVTSVLVTKLFRRKKPLSSENDNDKKDHTVQ